MIKYILVLFCLFLELPLVRASAQDLELNRRESAFSEQVQSQLQQILSGYYKDDTYLVNVKSHLERIPERKTAPETTEVMELPGLPVSPSLSP